MPTSCPCSVNANNDGTPSNPGPSYQDPHVSHTLQMAPLLPQGVHWLDEAFYASQGIQNGVFFPGRRLTGSGLSVGQPWLLCVWVGVEGMADQGCMLGRGRLATTVRSGLNGIRLISHPFVL